MKMLSHKKLLAVAALLMTLSFSLLYVRSRFLLLELSYQVGQLEQSLAKKENERDILLLELAVLKNPKRIAKIAKEKLNLNPSVHPISVTIKNSGGVHDF